MKFGMKKRRLALFMTLVLLCTTLNGITLSVSAGETEPVINDAVELFQEEEGMETVIPEADLTANEMAISDNNANEALILEEGIPMGAENAESSSDHDVTDAEGIGDVMISEFQDTDSILIEDVIVVEEQAEELLLYEAQEAARTAGGGYVGSTDYMEPPVVPFESGITLVGADTSNSWNYVKFTVPEDAGGEYEFTISAADALSAAYFTVYDRNTNIIFTRQNSEAVSEGAFFRGGESYMISYISSYNNKLNEITWNFARTKTWDEVKNDAEQISVNQTVNPSFETDNKGKFYKFVVPLGWQSGTYAELHGDEYQLRFYDTDLRHLNSDPLELTADSTVYVYIYGSISGCGFKLKNRIQELIAGARDLTLGTPASLNITENTSIMFKYVADETCEYFLETSEEYYVRLYGVYDVYGQVLDWADGIQFKKGNTYYLEIDCYNFDPDIDHYVLLTRGKIWSDILSSASELPEKAEDGCYYVESGVEDYEWYTFTPDKDGYYFIEGNSLRQKVIHQEDGEMVEDETNPNLYPSPYQLKKGETYCIGLCEAFTGDSNTVSLYIDYKAEITGITVTQERERYAEGLEDIFSLIEFTVTYSDGDSEELNNWNIIYEYNTETGEYEVCMNTMDPVYEWYIIAKLKQNDTIYNLDQKIAAGDYVLELFWNGVKMEEAPIKVTSMENSDLPSLNIGETLVHSSAELAYPSLYKFTAPESGTYRIKGFTTLFVYEKSESGYIRSKNYDPYICDLAVGDTCYLGFYDSLFDSQYSFLVSIERIPTLIDISVHQADDLKKIYFTNERFYHETYLLLTYDDDMTDRVRITTYDPLDTDDWGNEIKSIWYKDGELYEGSRETLEEGNYEIKFFCEEVVCEKSHSFKVISLDEIAQEVAVSTESEVIYTDDIAVVKFTPLVSGMHTIQTNISPNSVSVYDQTGDSLLYSSIACRYCVYLQANSVYYFYTHAENHNSSTVLIESHPLIRKAEVIPISGTHYAGVTNLDAAIQVKLTYEDGTTSIVENNDVDSYGNRVRCYLLTEENKRDYDSLNYSKDMGTYTIYPSIWDIGGSLDIYEPEAVIPAEVSVVLPNMDEFPAFSIDTYERISGGNTLKWYTFTAPADGEYTYSEEVPNSVSRVAFYKSGENRLTEYHSSVSLQKGEVCLVAVHTYNPVKLKIVNTNPFSGENESQWEMLPEVLELDHVYRVDIDGGNNVTVTYTPSENGMYVIESSNNYNVDPVVILWENGKELNNDDDGSYSERNFRLEYPLKAGVTYQYEMKDYGAGTGSFAVTLKKLKMESKSVKHIEFIFDEDAITEADDNHNRYFTLKVTYSDDSVQMLSYDISTDDYFNVFSYDITRISATRTHVNYKFTVSYYNRLTETVSDAHTESIVFSSKKNNALPALSLNNTISLHGQNGIYRAYLFTPQESGEYILKTVHEPDTDSGISVFELGGAGHLYYSWSAYGETTYTAYSLKEGITYRIYVEIYNSGDVPECGADFTIIKGNAVKALEIISKPKQQTVFPGTYVVSMDGLKAKITYQDGREETIAYGSFDSYGRTLSTYYNWLNDQTFFVRVRFGNYDTRFTLPAKTEDQSSLTVLKEDVHTDFQGLALFTPNHTAAYDVFLQFSGEASKDAHGIGIYDLDGNQISSTYKGEDVYTYWLEQGQTYLVSYGDPDITVTALIAEEVNCKWETISQIDPTCTEAGERKEYCTWHEDYRVVVLPATGHTITMTGAKAASCTEAGLTAIETCSVCKTLIKAQTSIPAKGHTWGAWKEAKATVFVEGSKTHTCSVCQTVETVKTADMLKATIELTAKKVTLQTGQSTKKFKVSGLAAGDSIVSMKLAKNKSVKISSVNLEKGTCKLTALNKTGKGKLTITLASGLKKTVTIKVQKGAVEASSIKVESKDITLLKKQKLTLKPRVQPFTCTDKLTYKTSDKKIVTVSKKGVLKGVKAGKAKITIQAGKKKVTVTVTVKKK